MEGLTHPRRIDIFTLTMGGRIREHYLEVFLDSLAPAIVDYLYPVRHTVFFQGTRPSKACADLLELRGVRVFVWPANIGRALGQKKAVELCGDCEILLRTDDDARILEADFLTTMCELNELRPSAFLHAYPVGTTGNVGGCKARGEREVAIGPWSGRYYGLRPVRRCGGLARAAAPATWEKIPWKDDLAKGPADIESAQLARACDEQSIPIYYAENWWVVEHQDSTIGQNRRKQAAGG